MTLLTVDALTVLICVVADLDHEYGTDFLLYRPELAHAEALLSASGFDEFVTGAPAVARPITGGFERRQGNRVEPNVADYARSFVADALYNDPSSPHRNRSKLGAVYRTVIECMSNTKGHASKDGTVFEDWWLSAYHDADKETVAFCFVDNGVGILKSGNVSFYRSVKRVVGMSGNDQILQDVFAGRVPSRTKQKGRGEGLPAMRVDCVEDALIENLTVVTNNVRAGIRNGDYQKLASPFAGTVVYFELSRTG